MSHSTEKPADHQRKSPFREILMSVVSTVLGGFALSFAFFIASDYIFEIPKLSGRWQFTGTTLETSLSRFEGLEVTYSVLLQQEGLKIFGTGEKIRDELDGVVTEYDGDRRTHIDITGYLHRKYLSKDELTLHYVERGRRRDSSTIQELIRFDEKKMSGNFESTIANSSGTVEWKRQ